MANRMTLLVGIIFIAAGVSIAPSATTRPTGQQSGEIGRFQLLQAKFIAASKNKDNSIASFPMEGVFKIDTVTGETWIFFSITAEGEGGRREWRPIETLPHKSPPVEFLLEEKK